MNYKETGALTNFFLGILFYLIITPVSLVMRLLGYDPLHRNIERDKKTYWVRKK